MLAGVLGTIGSGTSKTDVSTVSEGGRPIGFIFPGGVWPSPGGVWLLSLDAALVATRSKLR